jgi:anti-sigma factor RsiW
MNDTADEHLTALLDGELAEPERTAILRRLAAEPELQERFGALARARGALDSAFAEMLAQAPVARLRAMTAARPRPVKFAGGRLAASVVIALAGAALAAWLTLRATGDREDWTAAVLDYMQLYTPETFAGLAPDSAQEAAIVEKVGRRLGVGVTPAQLAAPGLAFKAAFVLSYEGKPLGEFVFVDAAGAPYLFCILADGAGLTPPSLENHEGLTSATWGRGDKRFLVIGPSATIIEAWSKALSSRV